MGDLFICQDIFANESSASGISNGRRRGKHEKFYCWVFISFDSEISISSSFWILCTRTGGLVFLFRLARVREKEIDTCGGVGVCDKKYGDGK